MYKQSKNTQAPAQTTTNTKAQVLPSAAMNKQQNVVTLTSSGFVPATITIKAGDKMVWENKSGDSATVNSNNHPTHLLYPPLNLGEFNDGQKLELVFPKAGSYGYHDHLHPERTGKVVVE